MVRQIHHHDAVDFNPVAHGHGRVIEKLRRDPGAANRIGALREIVIGDRSRELVQFDRKVSELHLSGQHMMQ